MRFAAAALIATLSLSARAKETVRIAFVGPLTGGNSAIGLGGRNSADLAVKLRNADAKAKYQYELLVLDDECKPDAGVQMATKAGSDRTVVGGVTHYCSVVAMATVDTYHRFGLPADSNSPACCSPRETSSRRAASRQELPRGRPARLRRAVPAP